jgi:hypothetical protein
MTAKGRLDGTCGQHSNEGGGTKACEKILHRISHKECKMREQYMKKKVNRRKLERLQASNASQ